MPHTSSSPVSILFSSLWPSISCRTGAAPSGAPVAASADIRSRVFAPTAKAKAAFFLFKKKNIDTKGDPSRADGRTRGSGVHILVMSSAGKDAKSKGPEIERFCRSKLQADYVILRTRCLRVCVCCGMRERADKRALRVAERGH